MSDEDSRRSEFFGGRRFAVAGRLISMTHAQVRQLVEANGGRFVTYPPRGQLVLIVGSDCWGLSSDPIPVDQPTDVDGHRPPTQLLRRIGELRALGYPIETLREAQFLELSGLTEPGYQLHGRHTLGDISRILRISPVRIRRWVRLGLIQPIESKHRLDFFNFDDVAFAKRLTNSISAGASLAEIRRQLEQVKKWLPRDGDLQRLVQLQQNGDVLIRMNEWLIDGRGQRYFDFEADDDQPPTMHVLAVAQLDGDELFDRAIRCEDEQQFEAAAAHYRQALEMDPLDPTLHFNLGNVCYQMQRFGEACDHYRRALELDESYAEAWNNLGNALTETESWPAAESALMQAITLVPTYADAHFNLSALYECLGQKDRADQYRMNYERHSTIVRLTIVRDE